MRTFSIVVVVVLGWGSSPVGASDEGLKFMLARSNYALAGEVVAEPAKWDRPFTWWGNGKDPQTVYEVRVAVLDQYQYQGGPDPHKEMPLYVLVPEGAERPEPLRKGGRCVFFVNWLYGGPGGSTSYVTADPWFGVQRHEPKLAEILKKLGKRPEPSN
jgi:hypothetical protein